MLSERKAKPILITNLITIYYHIEKFTKRRLWHFTLAFPEQQDCILQQNAILLFCWFY